VIQIDADPTHIGRRTSVDVGIASDVAPALAALLPQLHRERQSTHLDAARAAYVDWKRSQQKLTDPAFADRATGRLRSLVDNPDQRIRPELVAASVDRLAADDAIVTTDTGMTTVWVSRFVTMRGNRRLLGSFNFGSMANAMPQALGAQALDRSRQVIAMCGDGGLTMLLGDLLTAVTYQLPVTFVVFNNRDLGMVKLEQEEAGLPEGGTELANPDLAAVARAMGLRGVKVTDPAAVDDAVRAALAHPGPVLLDIETNAGELALPPHPSVGEAVGFAVGKIKEAVSGESGGST
jgi:pyruvate dehydrogenase (quinone)